jgi:hypothetical protein
VKDLGYDLNEDPAHVAFKVSISTLSSPPFVQVSTFPLCPYPSRRENSTDTQTTCVQKFGLDGGVVVDFIDGKYRVL